MLTSLVGAFCVLLIGAFMTLGYFRRRAERAQVKERLRRRRDIHRDILERYCHMLDVIKEPLSSRVIDIGCNTGVFTYMLASLGYNIQGVDISAKAINIAKRLGPKSENLHFRVEDAEHLSDLSGTYDWALIGETLEHVYNYMNILAEAQRVVKKGGRIYITVPREDMAPDPDHKHIFTEATVEALGKQLGVKIRWHNHPAASKYLVFSFKRP